MFDKKSEQQAILNLHSHGTEVTREEFYTGVLFLSAKYKKSQKTVVEAIANKYQVILLHRFIRWANLDTTRELNEKSTS